MSKCSRCTEEQNCGSHRGNNKNAIRTPEWRYGSGNSNRGKSPSQEIRTKISEAMKGRILSEEHKENLRKPKPPRSAEHSRNLSIAHKERCKHLSAEEREKLSQNAINSIRKSRKTLNKLEAKILDMLPKPWTFVGKGQLIVENKVPDFWDGNNKVIEAYGCYWHGCPTCFTESSKRNDPADRIEHFAKHGYECYVIWEHDVYEGNTQKMLEFAI